MQAQHRHGPADASRQRHARCSPGAKTTGEAQQQPLLRRSVQAQTPKYTKREFSEYIFFLSLLFWRFKSKQTPTVGVLAIAHVAKNPVACYFSSTNVRY